MLKGEWGHFYGSDVTHIHIGYMYCASFTWLGIIMYPDVDATSCSTVTWHGCIIYIIYCPFKQTQIHLFLFI